MNRPNSPKMTAIARLCIAAAFCFAGPGVWGGFDVHAACPADLGQVSSALDDAEEAYIARNVDALTKALGAARAAINCLNVPMTADLASRFHLGQGLQRATIQRDLEAARADFAAARYADPSAGLSQNLVSPGSPVREVFDTSTSVSPSTETVAAPAVGELRFDGRASLERPTAWPVVFQHLDDRGRVKISTYVGGTDVLPDYALRSANPGPDKVIPDPDPGQKSQAKYRPRWGFFVAGAAVGGVALTFNQMAFADKREYTALVEADGPASEIAELRMKIRKLNNANVGTALLAGGIGIIGFIPRKK